MKIYNHTYGGKQSIVYAKIVSHGGKNAYTVVVEEVRKGEVIYHFTQCAKQNGL